MLPAAEPRLSGFSRRTHKHSHDQRKKKSMRQVPQASPTGATLAKAQPTDYGSILFTEWTADQVGAGARSMAVNYWLAPLFLSEC